MIRLHDVSKTYDNGVRALFSTDIRFETGSFTVLLGKSGAGKSTLLRCINLLNVPSSGSVEIDGLGVVNRNAALQRRHRCATAMIFQQHQLIGRQSALKNVLMGRLGHYSSIRTLLPFPNSDKVIALECLERVGLLEKALERVDNLSGGQQQRVGIARGLAQQPRIMLADEPVASLDPATSAKVLGLLRTVCKEDGLTAVVSLHQVELALEFADRIVGLSGGRVVFDGVGGTLDKASIDRIYQDEPSTGSDPLDRGVVVDKPGLACQSG